MASVKSITRKLLVMLISFMLVFSNVGYTLCAIASSNEFHIIDNGFFKKDEIKFKAYFDEENDKDIDELIGDVNQKHRLVLEVNPQVQGYLKNATIKAVGVENEKINFKISGIKQDVKDLFKPSADLKLEDIPNITPIEDEKEIPKDIVENKEVENFVDNAERLDGNLEEYISTSTQNVSEILEPLENNMLNKNSINEPTSEIVNLENTQPQNPVNEISENEYQENVVAPENALNKAEDASKEDEMINEEEVIQEEIEKQKILEQEMQNLIADIVVTNDDEVSLSNIKENTKIELEIEYVQGEELKIEDLYKNIKLQLSGTFINEDLEEVEIGLEEEVIIGWKYSKDISLESEYIKFSPFEINEVTGTIVENKIVVARNIEDEKYLPVRQTKLEVEVPKLNNKLPIEIGLNADRLLLTRGENLGYTTFSQENWTYDEETGKVKISVMNELEGIAKNTKGVDEYIITYRYEDYVEEQISNLVKHVKVEVEEYNAKENNVITKEINNKQDIKSELGEIVTYSVSATEDKINKAKVYANYNSEEAIYETDYTTLVSLHILTSDVLERLTIDCTKEVYKDINGVEFDAQINTKQIKFNYSEVSELLSDGGEIVITNRNNEVLYVLNKDLLVSEDVCVVNVNNAEGIMILATGIAKNGTLNVELTKSIIKCNYEKATFKNFVEIESRVTAEIKYKDIVEPVKLEIKKASKELEESKTTANISLNKETLTTIQPNENVEIKIVLNNDQENSDLYVNPSFEIVFPKYVKEVNVESINMLYEDGLKVADFETYLDNDIVKMRVDFEGMQTRFSESEITNGTNIIINATIKVDKYTPAKEDQIKLYYCNEGVSNYGAQTKWTISKDIPNGILKTTNGFDVELIGYQAPTGLVVANGIVNYDGLQSEVTSVKQGEETRQIPMGAESRIATMELLAINNTGNTCTDVLFLGRVPFKGNKNVVTHEDIGTTIDALITDKIKEDAQNLNIATIYYSSNPEATVDLENEQNGWTTEITNINEVRSYLIEVNGNMASGTVLKYSYDFMIPENMPYDASIAGSFGAFYNNYSNGAIVYESSSADKVSLKTEAGPKLDATMTVDIGDGAVILSERRVKYTVTVVNSGSVPVENVTINAKLPTNSKYLKNIGSVMIGDLGFEEDGKVKEISENLGTLNPGEAKEYSYYVKTARRYFLEDYADGQDEKGYFIKHYKGLKPDVEVKEDIDIQAELEKFLSQYTDEQWNSFTEEERIKLVTDFVNSINSSQYTEEDFIIEKEYITEVPKMYMTSKATITSSSLTNPIETNETKNEIKPSSFAYSVKMSTEGTIHESDSVTYNLELKNITLRNMNNVKVKFYVGNIYEFNSLLINDEEKVAEFDRENGIISFDIENINSDETKRIALTVKATVTENPSDTYECYFEFLADNIETETSTKMSQTINRPLLVIEDMTVNLPGKIGEEEMVTISTVITNKGTILSSSGKFQCQIPEAVEIESLKDNNGKNWTNGRKLTTININLPDLAPEESITFDLILKAKNLAGSQDTLVTVNRGVIRDNDNLKTIEPVEFIIVNNLKTEQEIEDQKVLDQIEEDKKNEQENKPENKPDEKPVEDENNQNPSNENIQDDSSNNTNNNPQDTIPPSDQKPSEPQIDTEETPKTYEISGIAWFDENKNGGLEDSEKGISGVKVYLIKPSNEMVKSTVTGADGKYKFTDLEQGSYIVEYSFDETKYQITVYRKVGISEERNSEAVKVNTDSISATTNNISISDRNVENVNIGLQTKDVFDLAINKYISNIKVTTSKETLEYKQDNLDVAKVEIKSRYINGAKVELEYTIIVENIGNVDGYAEEIVDYLEEGLTFDASKNEDWYKGKDGYIYAKNVNDIRLEPGETKELKLVLTKTMTEENTGIVSNKVNLLGTFTESNAEENSNNNTSVQNTFITVSTGYTKNIVIFTSSLLILGTIVYFKFIRKATISFVRFKPKIYKAQVKVKGKTKTKKWYK